MRELRVYEAIVEALAEEMRQDERVFLMGEDIGFFGGTFRATEGLMAEFGSRRVRDTPIAEAGIVGLALGAAFAGLRPVPELMTMNFAIVAMDQIINHVAKMRYMFGGQFDLPVTIRAPGGGGTQKGAQHSHSIESWFVNDSRPASLLARSTSAACPTISQAEVMTAARPAASVVGSLALGMA